LFFESLLRILETFESNEVRAFWTLLLVGRAEHSSTSLMQLFLASGLIHLLVLSGSQIEHFRNMLLLVLGALGRFAGCSRASIFFSVSRICVTLILLFYVWDVGEPAPLVRALLLRLSLEVWREDLSPNFKIFFAGLAHVALYPEHLESTSFYLSWTSYILLLAMGRLGLRAYVMLFVMSVVCQWVVCFLKKSPAPSLDLLLITASMNMLMIPLFERILFPLGASLLLWSLPVMLFSWWGFAQSSWRWFFDSLRILYEIPVELVLGVLKGIRYY
jgi:hypothetical protein